MVNQVGKERAMEIRPEDTIGYWLFYAQRCVEYAFSEVLRRCCLEQGKAYVVTPPQWGILSALYFEHDGLPIGALSQKRGFDAPTITGIVKRLEQSGLVERQHSDEDRRIVKVSLTTEGKEIMSPIFESVASFDEIIRQGFSPIEAQDVVAKMQQIVMNVSDVAPGMGDRFHLLPGHFYEAETDFVIERDTAVIEERREL
jgi:DNA-binding MarR family transcriptional regulator